jgi:hypothetical protein
VETVTGVIQPDFGYDNYHNVPVLAPGQGKTKTEATREELEVMLKRAFTEPRQMRHSGQLSNA